IVATGNLKGNNIYANSFDSSDPLFSTQGQYDPAKARDNTTLSFGSLNLGNSVIAGQVSVEPEASLEVAANGVVGDFAWINAGNAGIEPGKASTELNPDFPDVTVTFTNGLSPLTGIWTTNTVFTYSGTNLITNYVIVYYDYGF